MEDYLGKLGDIFADLSPGVIIGSLAIALVLALIGSASHVLLARVKKGGDPVAPLCGLMFVVSVASMAIAVGYVQITLREGRTRPAGATRPASTSPPGGAILEAADVNQDGHLTTREMVELVRRADTSRKGYADQFDLDHASRSDTPAPALAEGPGDRPWMLPGPRHPNPWPRSVACFPPTGGATGHDIWPRITRHSETPRLPRM